MTNGELKQILNCHNHIISYLRTLSHVLLLDTNVHNYPKKYLKLLPAGFFMSVFHPIFFYLAVLLYCWPFVSTASFKREQPGAQLIKCSFMKSVELDTINA